LVGVKRILKAHGYGPDQLAALGGYEDKATAELAELGADDAETLERALPA
jgi:hypothetical protein